MPKVKDGSNKSENTYRVSLFYDLMQFVLETTRPGVDILFHIHLNIHEHVLVCTIVIVTIAQQQSYFSIM